MGNMNYLRDVIGKYMTILGEKDDRVVIVNADLAGTSRNKGFVERFPERSFNVGIAEQNMVSFAAGLAHEGFKPYAFSMAPFITMRACEQCRTDVAYAKADVKLMGTYSGLSGGISGATHWGVEDCAVMTGIPGIIVLEPSDMVQAEKIMELSLKYSGPMYIRITCEPCENIYDNTCNAVVGGAAVVAEGNDGAILCSGVTVQYAVKAAKRLKKEGIHVSVTDMYSIKPVDKAAVAAAARTGNVLVVQDHNIIGGLGSLAAKVIAEEGLGVKFKILGINDSFFAMAHADYLYHKLEYDAEGIYITMKKMLTNGTAGAK